MITWIYIQRQYSPEPLFFLSLALGFWMRKIQLVKFKKGSFVGVTGLLIVAVMLSLRAIQINRGLTRLVIRFTLIIERVVLLFELFAGWIKSRSQLYENILFVLSQILKYLCLTGWIMVVGLQSGLPVIQMIQICERSCLLTGIAVFVIPLILLIFYLLYFLSRYCRQYGRNIDNHFCCSKSLLTLREPVIAGMV